MPINVSFLAGHNSSSFIMEPPRKRRRIYIEDDRPSFCLPNEILELIFSYVPVKSLLIIRTLNEYARNWSNRRIEQVLRKRFGLNYSGNLLAGNLRIDFWRLFMNQIWKIEGNYFRMSCNRSNLSAVLLDRIEEYEISNNISINNEFRQKEIADSIGDILQKIPQSYLQWCYAMTHWRERRHAIRLKELDLESVLNRTVFIDCYKSWKYIERSISASDGWIKMIMFGTDSSGKMATIYYHYSVTRREDIIGSKDFKVKFMCLIELGFINDKENSNNIIIAPLEYFEQNTGDIMYDEDDLNELYEQEKIEHTLHENYVPCDMSFHVSKNDRDMRMLMDWIGCSKEISTRNFYDFLQSIMVQYRLSNHEARCSINYPSDFEREEIKKYSAIYDKIVNLHLYREKLLFGIELKDAILGNKLFKDITNERKNELDLLMQRCNIKASLVARSNPRSKQTKSMYKYIRLSIIPLESNEPIIFTARMAIEWKKGQIRLTLTIQSVPNGWNEPNETDWNNLSVRTTCYNSDQTFILEDLRQSVVIFHEQLSFDWSSNDTEQLRESKWKKELNLMNCKYLTAADLLDIFIALFGLQTSLVEVSISSSDPANTRSYQIDLRRLTEIFLTNGESPPSWPVEMVRERTQSDYDCDSAFERGDCSLDSSDEDQEYYYKEISTTQNNEQQSRWCIIQ